MPQAAARSAFPTRIGVAVAMLAGWSFLIWNIWKVSVDLFQPSTASQRSESLPDSSRGISPSHACGGEWGRSHDFDEPLAKLEDDS